jgi:murein DD-endopeptidase MepM/ murein hydrolase activator NlpD
MSTLAQVGRSRRSAPRAWCAGAIVLLASTALGQSDGSGFGAAFGGADAQWAAQQHELETQRARKGAAEQTLASIAPRDAEASAQLTRDARALYRLSRGGMLPLAGGISALLGHASRVSRLEKLVQRDLKAVQALRSEGHRLRGEIGQLGARIDTSERNLAALSTARIGAARERALQTGLEAALQSLPAPQSLPSRAQYGLTLAGSSDFAGERFTEQRGNLALPISGPTRIEEARRAESDGPGLAFVGSAGAAVRAAAGGRVAFAESYGSYGKLVIVEHGERYYTVYGGLDRYEVQVGDGVSKSARLGSLGAAPLYFEVRRGTKSQDARTWLGL